MRLTKAQQKHANEAGQRWDRAFIRASTSVSSNSKLTGLKKIKQAVAWQAALKATGYELKWFSVPKDTGKIDQEILDIAQIAFEQAVEAAADGDAAYDGQKDFAGSLEVGYETVKERVAAGGDGWNPK